MCSSIVVNPPIFFPEIKCTSFILILRAPYYGEAAKIYHLKFCAELNHLIHTLPSFMKLSKGTI